MELKGEEYFDVDSLDESIVSMESVTPEGIYASALSCMPQIKQAHYSLQSKVKSTKVVEVGILPTAFFGCRNQYRLLLFSSCNESVFLSAV